MSSSNWLELLADADSSGGGSFAPVPAGDYDLKILEATHKVSSSGKPMFGIKAEVQTGPHAKRLIWSNLVVSRENPKALGFFFRNMAALGLGPEFFQQNPNDQQIVQALTGRNFRAKVKISTFNGKESNDIETYYPQSAGAPVGAPPVPGAAPAPAPIPAPAPAAPPVPQTDAGFVPTQLPAPTQLPQTGGSPWGDAPSAAPLPNSPF